MKSLCTSLFVSANIFNADVLYHSPNFPFFSPFGPLLLDSVLYVHYIDESSLQCSYYPHFVMMRKWRFREVKQVT